MLFPEHRNHLTALPRISVNGQFQRLRYLRVRLSGAATASWEARSGSKGERRVANSGRGFPLTLSPFVRKDSLPSLFAIRYSLFAHLQP